MHTISETARPAGGAARPASTSIATLAGWAGSLLRRVLSWSARARQRRALMALDDWMLKDIGLSRTDIEHEAMKPFWRD